MTTQNAYQYRTLYGAEALSVVEELGHLRIIIFREFPYLYVGSMEYERRYLQTYFRSPQSIVILIEHGGHIIGASMGLPLADAEDEIHTPLVKLGYDSKQVFYCGEALLLPEFRAQGLSKKIFALGDQHARQIGARWQAFVTVVRPENHPLRPLNYISLEGLWRAQGFVKLDGVLAYLKWQDLTQSEESEHALEYWIKPLT